MKIGISDACSLLGLPYQPGRNGAVDIKCPNCGKKKLHIDFVHNIFNCPACGEIGGGALDFWAYYRKIEGTSRAEKYKLAKIDLESFVKNNQDIADAVKLQPKKILEVRDIKALSARKCAKTNAALLDSLILTKLHRDNLRQRGLSDEMINKFGYKSYPTANFDGIANNLLSSGYLLEGIPGFYKKNDKWRIRELSSGILIPVRNGLNEIQGFQVRLDNSRDGTRYLTLSTKGKTQGSGGTAYMHLTKGNNDFKELILTEGPLKADIISAYTGYPVLAIPGVNSIKRLPDVLQQIKNSTNLETICICLDMDLYTNENVLNALKKITDIIESLNIPYSRGNWNTEYKGLDDYLLFKKGKLFN